MTYPSPDGTQPTEPIPPRPEAPAYDPPPEAPVTSPTAPYPVYQPASYQPGVARPTYPPTAGYPVYDPNAAYPGYAAPPRRRSGLVVGLVVATVVLICAALGVAGAVLFVNVAKNVVASGDTPNPQPAGPGPSSDQADDKDTKQDEGDGEILIEVTGDGPVSIFYGAGGGKSEDLRSVDLPWKIRLPKEGQAQIITVLATRVALTDGKVTCRISLEGTKLQEQTKDGKFALATCITLV
jgi:hypothetical protein